MSHCGNSPNPCVDCGRERAVAEEVADQVRLGQLNDQMLEWAVEHWSGPTGVKAQVWECEAQRAVREAMAEFLTERNLGDDFEQWLLEDHQIETQRRNHTLDGYRKSVGKPLDPDVRKPNAAARCILATIEGDRYLREEFEAAEVSRRLEPEEADA